jgi:hypothetical protein
MTEPTIYEPKDPAGLGKTVVLWLWIHLAFALLSVMVLGIMSQALFLADLGETLAPKEVITFGPTIDMIGHFVGLGSGGAGIITGVLILMWIYRVNWNACSLASDMVYSPRGAVGWFFVPVANLFKPFEALRETWQVSRNPGDWRNVPTPVAFRWWWGLLLVVSIVRATVRRSSGDAETMEILAGQTVIDLAFTLVMIPLDLVFIWIVKRLTQQQIETLAAAQVQAIAA